MVYDRSGNLVYDGTYWYRYDAWHRLIQIVEAPAGGYTFDANGKKFGSGPAFADVVAVYAYDGLGRLVGRQAPYPGTTDEWRTETYLYDGDRRIAERWRDPIINNNGGGANGFQQQAATHTLWTEREYVHTPGYIDEFVGEIDANGVLWPILQDANQNAVAMLDSAGAVVRQRILSPYGRVIASEVPTGVTPPKSRIGHQGLFADRLDAPTTADPLDASAHTIWHNRNRTLLPELGRFAQRDPNATGQGASSMLDMHGTALHDGVSPPDPAALFGDGQNVYAYAVASPTQHRDPSGLVIGFLVPGPSDFITGALQSLVEGYAANLDWDVDWATDWSLPDSLHSRTDNLWIWSALGRGLYDAFSVGIPGTGIQINPLDLIAGRGGWQTTVRVGGVRATHSGWKTIPAIGRNHRVLFFKHPDYPHPFVKFSKASIEIEVRITPGVAGKTDQNRAWKEALARHPRKAQRLKDSGLYMWHHDTKRNTMQLIPRDLHDATIPHTGGKSLWGGGYR